MKYRNTFFYIALSFVLSLVLYSCGDNPVNNEDNTLVLQKTTLDSLNFMIKDDPENLDQQDGLLDITPDQEVFRFKFGCFVLSFPPQGDRHRRKSMQLAAVVRVPTRTSVLSKLSLFCARFVSFITSLAFVLLLVLFCLFVY